MGKYYSYSIIRSKGNAVEYAIYSYFSDGSFDDVENIITLNKNDSIEDYILERYGRLLPD